MSVYDKDKAGEIALHAVEEFKNVALSFLGPAGATIEVFLGFHSRLKQKRILDFSGQFKELIEENLGRGVTADSFSNEDFVDVMESVFAKVQTTKSEEKLKRYRNILLRQLLEPIDSGITLTYVRLLDEISETELLLLQKISQAGGDIPESGMLIHLFGIATMDESVSITYDGATFNLSNNELDYYVHHLSTMGLLELYTEVRESTMPNLKSTITGLATAGHRPTERKYVGVTKFSGLFINFIKKPADDSNANQDLFLDIDE